ncbi:hypothetical protein MTO96_049514 [Rhipicephalus appendiculatus]
MRVTEPREEKESQTRAPSPKKPAVSGCGEKGVGVIAPYIDETFARHGSDAFVTGRRPGRRQQHAAPRSRGSRAPHRRQSSSNRSRLEEEERHATKCIGMRHRNNR